MLGEGLQSSYQFLLQGFNIGRSLRQLIFESQLCYGQRFQISALLLADLDGALVLVLDQPLALPQRVQRVRVQAERRLQVVAFRSNRLEIFLQPGNGVGQVELFRLELFEALHEPVSFLLLGLQLGLELADAEPDVQVVLKLNRCRLEMIFLQQTNPQLFR